MLERESHKVNDSVYQAGRPVLSIQHMEGYFFMVTVGSGGRSAKSLGISCACALADNEHATSRLARRPRMILPIGCLLLLGTRLLLGSKRCAESSVFRNTWSIKPVWVKKGPHNLVTESHEIQEGIKMIHADRAREPK